MRMPETEMGSQEAQERLLFHFVAEDFNTTSIVSYALDVNEKVTPHSPGKDGQQRGKRDFLTFQYA